VIFTIIKYYIVSKVFLLQPFGLLDVVGDVALYTQFQKHQIKVEYKFCEYTHVSGRVY